MLKKWIMFDIQFPGLCCFDGSVLGYSYWCKNFSIWTECLFCRFFIELVTARSHFVDRFATWLATTRSADGAIVFSFIAWLCWYSAHCSSLHANWLIIGLLKRNNGSCCIANSFSLTTSSLILRCRINYSSQHAWIIIALSISLVKS